jgi:hypothetical protein
MAIFRMPPPRLQNTASCRMAIAAPPACPYTVAKQGQETDGPAATAQRRRRLTANAPMFGKYERGIPKTAMYIWCGDFLH